jgi:hypoxanthine phosphoribosyltransferase
MLKRYLSFDHVKGYCNEIIRQMVQDDWSPDVIVGLTRGGLLPATMLSHWYGIGMETLSVALRDGGSPESNLWLAEEAYAEKRILIVDDINDTGATLNWIVNDWKASGPPGNNPADIWEKIDNEASKAVYPPSYFGELINKAEKDQWIVFPFEEWWK